MDGGGGYNNVSGLNAMELYNLMVKTANFTTMK